MQTEYPHNAPWQHAPEQQYRVMPPQPPAPQPGMVWLPPVANDRSTLDLRLRGGLGILCALAVSSFYLPSSLGSDLSNFPGLVYLLFILLCSGWCLIFGIRILLQPRHWSVVNQRRQWAAAYGSASGVPLAEPHPFPNIEALPLPFTIKLKRQWLFILFGFCLYMVLLLVLQLPRDAQRDSLAEQKERGELFSAARSVDPLLMLPLPGEGAASILVLVLPNRYTKAVGQHTRPGG